MDYTTASLILSGEQGYGYARQLYTPRPERESVKVANNTYLERRGPEAIALRLHATDVLLFTPEYVELNTGGWYTATTKDRLNYGPVTVGSDKGKWIVQPSGYNPWGKDGFNYRDGIRFTNDGQYVKPEQAPAPMPDNEPVKREIKRFAAEAIRQLREGLPVPSGGDCWYCVMKTETGDSLGDAFQDTEHLLDHMRENYIVPSLLLNALREQGYRHPEFQLGIHENGDGYAMGGTTPGGRPRAMEDSVSNALKRYLKRRLVPNETA